MSPKEEQGSTALPVDKGFTGLQPRLLLQKTGHVGNLPLDNVRWLVPVVMEALVLETSGTAAPL